MPKSEDLPGRSALCHVSEPLSIWRPRRVLLDSALERDLRKGRGAVRLAPEHEKHASSQDQKRQTRTPHPAGMQVHRGLGAISQPRGRDDDRERHCERQQRPCERRVRQMQPVHDRLDDLQERKRHHAVADDGAQNALALGSAASDTPAPPGERSTTGVRTAALDLRSRAITGHFDSGDTSRTVPTPPPEVIRSPQVPELRKRRFGAVARRETSRDRHQMFQWCSKELAQSRARGHRPATTRKRRMQIVTSEGL
jgi:hypothetical protein